MIRKMTALLLVAAMCGGVCTGFAANVMAAENSASDLSAPRIEVDSSMEAGQKVTWDCVWFGSYPQSEVTSSDPVYKTLQDADGWDNNNDISVDGKRYRRMKKEDATYASEIPSDFFYNWSDTDSYHYFKYEPIKWRVLKKEGSQALLLSDVVLDDQKYNTVREDVTWKNSTIRNWLNGYNSSYNQQETEYNGRNFIGSAFSSSEQSAIADTSVANTDNLSYGTEGGNDTTDKVFLLSELEVYGADAMSYGFVLQEDTSILLCDEARRSKSSTYAKAMGGYSDINDEYKGNALWWLRSPGDASANAVIVNYNGYGISNGWPVDFDHVGVRPALNLNLSSSQWSYAGTVCSDESESSGGDGEEEIAVTGLELLSEENLNLTVGDTSLVECKVIPSNAANQEIYWTSEDEEVATVDEEGLITCVGAGSTFITATTEEGEFTQEVEVIVREKPSADKEGAPKVTADSVTWNGGVLEIPVDLKGYIAEDISCNVVISDRNSSKYLWGKLTDNILSVSVVEQFESCDREPLFGKKGTYTVTVGFEDASTHEEICENTLDVLILEDSAIWRVTEELVEFDGNEDVVFYFQNGTNNYKLQSVTSIEVFTGKGDVGAPFPVLTEGFKVNMAAGTLTIDRNVLKNAIKEYVDKGGYLGERVSVNVTALTDAGEEVRFNRIDWKDSPYGGTTTAWELDVTKLGLTSKPEPTNPVQTKPAVPEKVMLSSASYTYDGKVKQPTVSVKDSNGKTISASDYVVSYLGGCKNVGRYTVKVDFKGSYTGSMTKTFDIKPKKTAISKVVPGKKRLTVKWKKQMKQTSGYQIQYSTNKKFKKGNHTVFVNKNKTTQRKIIKLKAKKKYYVRIRTYKAVKINGNPTKIYSNWSKAKSAAVKK